MLKRLVLAMPAIFCWGCVAPGWQWPGVLTPQGAAVQLADENIVRQCQYLGDVTGGSSTVTFARNDALNQAASMQATHVVFVSETAYQAMARAYRCPAPTPAPAPVPVPAPAAVGSDDSRVAKVRAREQAAGAAAAADQH
jgi:hypothetical protein